MKRLLFLLITYSVIMSTYAVNSLNVHQSELRSDIITFLQEEGLTSGINNDGDIFFKRGGIIWYISISSNDDMPMFVSLFRWQNYSDKYNKETISEILANLNMYKGVKVVIGNSGFKSSAEMFVVNAEPMKYAFYKLLHQLESMDDKLDILIEESNVISFQRADIANVEVNDSIIDNYGKPIYNYRAKYLKLKLYGQVRTSGDYTFYVKIYNPEGNLLTDSYSPAGYTYSYSLRLEQGLREMSLKKFGKPTIGYWKGGKYKVEFYVNGKKIGEKEFNIYGK